MSTSACPVPAPIGEDKPKRPHERHHFKPWQTLTCVLLVLLLCLASSYSFRMLRAAAVLGFLGTKPRPLRIYDRFFGHHVDMAEMTIPGTLGPVQIRVYTPRGVTNLVPLLFVHGFAPDGNNDSYLNRVAIALTEMGYMVVLPYIPAETKFEMLPSDMTVIDDAIRWTAKNTGQKVSIFGISFGAGLCIPAALQPAVNGDVKLIFALSGYNDLDAIGRYYLHERVTDPSGVPYPGNPPGPLVIVSPYLQELVPPRDLPAISKELDQLKHNQGRKLTSDDPSAQLSQPERNELNELESVSTPQIRRLYLEVLVHHHSEIAAISPSSVLGRLNVPLYVLHGESDPVFPVGEVEWMRKELAGNPNAHILVSPWLAHAIVGQPATRRQKLRVVNFAAQLLLRTSRSEPVVH